MKKLFYIVTLIVFAAWAAGYCWFNYHIFHYQADSTQKTDAIIVLTGGRNRIAEGAKLLKRGLAQKLFISGVDENSSLQAIEKINDLDFEKKQQVYIGKKAMDTVGNANEAKEWIMQNNINSIRLVTSNYHMPRSLAEFRALNPKLTIIPHPVYSEKVSKKWWKKWKTGKLTASEYSKFLYVCLRNILTAKE